jgi:hypothetical protein
MFLMHAVYGLGATVSPFVSTAFVQHEPTHVYYYFAVSLALAILTALVLALVFRGRTEDQVVGKRLPDEESSTEVQGGVPMTTTGTSVGVESGVVTPLEKEPRRQPARRSEGEARRQRKQDEEDHEDAGDPFHGVLHHDLREWLTIYWLVCTDRRSGRSGGNDRWLGGECGVDRSELEGQVRD